MMHKGAKLKADEYVARMFSGEMSDGDVAEIESWKNASADHTEALQDSLQAWSEVELLEDDQELRGLMDDSAAPPLRSKAAKWLPLAASLAIAAILLQQWTGNTPTQERMLHVSTAVGEQKTVQLFDGSLMELNTNSEVVVTYTDDHREILLNRGEAFFDVKSEPARPFVVDVGTHSVTALGTRFNVHKASRKEISVAVLEGIVGVHSGTSPGFDDINPLTPPGDDETELRVQSPDQMVLARGSLATIYNQGQFATVERLSENSTQAAWRTGRIRFNEHSLEEVVNELNRYSDRPILIQDGSIRQEPIGGIADLKNLDEFINGLAFLYPINITWSEDRIVISSK